MKTNETNTAPAETSLLSAQAELEKLMAELEAKKVEIQDKMKAGAQKVADERTAKINTLPGLLGVETLAIVASLLSSVMKNGKVPAELGELSATERKTRVMLTPAQRLEILVEHAKTEKNGLPFAPVGRTLQEKYSVSGSTINNIVGSKEETVADAVTAGISIPESLRRYLPKEKSKTSAKS